MRSVMKHQFSQVPKVTVPRSQFNRGHGRKMTFDAGYIYPVLVDEVLPGDTFNVKLSAFMRLNTPIFPIMDNMYCDVHYFFVPNRLVWENWQKFCGEQESPGDSIDYTIPVVDYGPSVSAEGTLADYFGLPMGIAGLQINALPFRGYHLIFNEWYRDQNLIDSVDLYKDDGPDSYSTYSLQRRCKRHDYFTSCLPWPQKGDAVDLPLGTSAPLSGGPLTHAGNGAPLFSINSQIRGLENNAGNVNWGSDPGGSGTDATWSDPKLSDHDLSGVTVDLSSATAATVNELRQAFQVQKLLEKDARGGTRYVEILANHFGVTSPDARLQRPEYLGGGTFPINITPIAQTSETSGTPQGTLAAIGTGSGRGIGFTKSFVEHGYVFGLMSVRADLTYQNGLNRMWSRETRYDFYWPSLAHIGEQAVLAKELHMTGVSDDVVFGYQERHAEYRYKPSEIVGKFRSSATGSLDAWHLSQEFSVHPPLAQAFIEEDPPIARVVAVDTEPDFMADLYFDMKCARPMPMYSVPGLIDHF